MGSIALYRGSHVHGLCMRASTSAPARRRGILRRIFDAIALSQQRHAEREAGRFIAAHGGRLTDDVERQLMKRFTEIGFRP
jgi:hypothetical protein